ncbi:MAG: endonuclease/exonuclease/phosphatase family protein [Anaerolineales bacterium]|uniref:endonuclease/exonuclease/phosphatase family protein n=1 Tax=Promineifilum sp. TaxID=2664178 RepID=UPI001D630955|nr:endonuclease/exonuclease/phosphatase family protein [Anaerolineales bacterium]MCB8936110.1 endonuclease/exonuclease/phosphatase family protein [Promineifilum sp.]MCO5180404.1 endonuclease/exonuclease/phosphatase family protein [Promineifilum sp.]
MMSQRFTIKNAAVWLGLPAILALCGLAACAGIPATATTIGAIPAMNFSNGLNALAANVLPQTENYIDPAGPLFTGEAALQPRPAPDDIVVVSYNLRYGEAITETIRAFQEIPPLPDADIILLQEMDEAGVAAIAAALDFNYVYYPASVAEDGDNFGNAILARWPIIEPTKLILPGLHPLTGQQRTATRAVVQLGDAPVVVYSTHIEVSTAPSAMRAAQVDALLDDIPAGASLVIVGGDFNTVTGRGVRALAAQFDGADLDQATADLGPTYTRFGLRPSATDHLFSRGFRPRVAGVLDDVTASDHFPVWARLGTPFAQP